MQNERWYGKKPIWIAGLLVTGGVIAAVSGVVSTVADSLSISNYLTGDPRVSTTDQRSGQIGNQATPTVPPKLILQPVDGEVDSSPTTPGILDRPATSAEDATPMLGIGDRILENPAGWQVAIIHDRLVATRTDLAQLVAQDYRLNNLNEFDRARRSAEIRQEYQRFASDAGAYGYFVISEETKLGEFNFDRDGFPLKAAMPGRTWHFRVAGSGYQIKLPESNQACLFPMSADAGADLVTRLRRREISASMRLRISGVGSDGGARTIRANAVGFSLYGENAERAAFDLGYKACG